MVTNGKYKFFTCSYDEYSCNTYSFDGKYVLVAGNGSLYVKAFNGKFDAYQRTYAIKCNSNLFASIYLSCLSKLESLRKKANGSIVKFIKIGMINEIDIPIFDENKQKELNQLLDLILVAYKENEFLYKVLKESAENLLAEQFIL